MRPFFAARSRIVWDAQFLATLSFLISCVTTLASGHLLSCTSIFQDVHAPSRFFDENDRVSTLPSLDDFRLNDAIQERALRAERTAQDTNQPHLDVVASIRSNRSGAWFEFLYNAHQRIARSHPARHWTIVDRYIRESKE